MKNVSIVVTAIPRNWEQFNENSGLNTGNKHVKKYSDDTTFNCAEKIDKNHAVGVDDSVSDSASSYSDTNDKNYHELKKEDDNTNNPAHDHYSDSNSEEKKSWLKKED